MFLVLAMLAAGAAAEPPDGVQTRRQEAPVVLKPTWLGKPTLGDYSRYYPSRAAVEGFEGRAMLDCHVQPDGNLRDCSAQTEGPYADEFREAALHLAAHFRAVSPGSSDATVRFPIRFVIPANATRPIRVVQPGAREGEIKLDCRVSPERSFDNCFVLDSDPPRPDLHDAALKVAAKLAVPSDTPLGLRMIIPIHVTPKP